MMLQVVLCAYSQGIVSSCRIECVCNAHVTFIARWGDSAPHFTMIARFVSTLNDDIAHAFAAVVAVCDHEGLITREMCAIDGVTLPSPASTPRSGTLANFEHQAATLEAVTTAMLARHRERMRGRSSPTWPRTRRNASRGWSGTARRCATGSPCASTPKFLQR